MSQCEGIIGNLVNGWSDEEDQGAPSCTTCGATQTPQWREGPLGPKTLCNACGVKYYRTHKRSRSRLGGGTGSSKPPKAARRQNLPLFTNSLIGPSIAGDSGDDETLGQFSLEEDNNSDESEEHVAALSLLSFAGFGRSAGYHREGTLAMNFSSDPRVSAIVGKQLISSPLPVNEVALLQEMQTGVQQAYRELQAADAASNAVAQYLNEKREQAAYAQERAQNAARLLLDEMRKLEDTYHLKSNLAAQQISGLAQAIPS